MQLNNINTRKLLPFTLSCGMVASAFAFSYSSIGNSGNINSVSCSPIENLMLQSNDYYYSKLTLEAQFNKRVAAWKKRTKFMSFADQIVNDINFKIITSMGDEVVPFILDDIRKEPSPLVWALNIIYNKTISKNPHTTIEEACKLWMKELS